MLRLAQCTASPLCARRVNRWVRRYMNLSALSARRHILNIYRAPIGELASGPQAIRPAVSITADGVLSAAQWASAHVQTASRRPRDRSAGARRQRCESAGAAQRRRGRRGRRRRGRRCCAPRIFRLQRRAGALRIFKTKDSHPPPFEQRIGALAQLGERKTEEALQQNQHILR